MRASCSVSRCQVQQAAPRAGNAPISFPVRASAHERSVQAYSRCVPIQVPGLNAHDCSLCRKHIKRLGEVRVHVL